MTTPFPRPLATMEAKVKDDFPENGWAYEPKWDGFRALAWSDGPYLDSRSQKPLLRYFPELTEAISGLPKGTVVDSEIVVVTGDQLSFDSLQMRLHPAESRVQRLSAEIPAEMVAFDLLALKGEDLRDRPFSERRTKLKKLLGKAKKPWNLTPSTTDIEVGRRWFDEFESAGCDGIVAKQLDSPYVSGKREMVKIKHRRSVDVVIGGFREHKDGGKIGSLLLGLYNDAGELHFIGHCSGFSNHDRVEMLKRFEALTVDGSFGEKARRPGGQSRWSAGKDLSWTPIEPGVVIEVSYDQITGERFRHATRFERWRPDKSAQDCTMDQLQRPNGPGYESVVDSA